MFRIGINLGDVIVEGDDIYGDGVNVAARLEALAEPGGICISASAPRAGRDKLTPRFDDLGEQHVKNIARPGPRIPDRPTGAAPGPIPSPAAALRERPSIAVLPFQNMSGDAEQDYFGDG